MAVADLIGMIWVLAVFSELGAPSWLVAIWVIFLILYEAAFIPTAIFCFKANPAVAGPTNTSVQGGAAVVVTSSTPAPAAVQGVVVAKAEA